MYGNDGDLRIGNYLNVNRNVMINAAQGKITNGDHVLIGPNSVIRAANHGVSKHELIQAQSHLRGEIIIENDVWIGANVVVVPNVIIRRGTVVAAGSLVNKDTKPYSIVAGIPAKPIGQRDG